MKKTLSILLSLIFCLVLAYSASADEEGNATAHIYVDVVPNVAVGILSAHVNAGEVQTGEFSAQILFRIDANMESVWLRPYASHLFKGDDPTITDVEPIPLSSTGITIQPTDANPTDGLDNIAEAVPDTTIEYNGFTLFCYESIEFESSQNGHFSQDVLVEVYWDQSDPEKPQGEYSGHVQLVCMLNPPA